MIKYIVLIQTATDISLFIDNNF